MAPRDTWTDERIDDFRAETKREFTAMRTEVRDGFARVDRKFAGVDKRLDKIDERFEGVNREFVAVRMEMKEGFDKLNRTLHWFCGSLLVAVIASLFTLTASLVIS
jgi:tetrahydromethanopterin S-methyltransferase subunit G